MFTYNKKKFYIFNLIFIFMRLWSIHPKYLDKIGLLACWREWLLALNVLAWNTKGYKNHPQLNRFKNTVNPINYINVYLTEIYKEAINRNYNFDSTKINTNIEITEKIEIKLWQIEYEFSWLMYKLKIRNKEKYNQFKNTKNIEVNPIFEIISWWIESWEIIKKFDK